jgi:hypothetical protein
MPSVRAGGLLLLAALTLPGVRARAEEVKICYNYGCNARAPVDYSGAELEGLHRLLAAADDAAAERAAISLVIGRMYAIAGAQTPVWRDKGGNYADGGENGEMDCIDHSTNSSAFLRLLQMHGWLRYHEVLEPVMRSRLFFFEHWAARIRERATRKDYVVDSWFFDNGRPALVLPAEDWFARRTPHVQ